MKRDVSQMNLVSLYDLYHIIEGNTYLAISVSIQGSEYKTFLGRQIETLPLEIVQKCHVEEVCVRLSNTEKGIVPYLIIVASDKDTTMIEFRLDKDVIDIIENIKRKRDDESPPEVEILPEE